MTTQGDENKSVFWSLQQRILGQNTAYTYYKRLEGMGKSIF